MGKESPSKKSNKSIENGLGMDLNQGRKENTALKAQLKRHKVLKKNDKTLDFNYSYTPVVEILDDKLDMSFFSPLDPDANRMPTTQEYSQSILDSLENLD